MPSVSAAEISSTFIWRRVHSLMGFWLVLYLILHLLTNSQAALWIGDDGNGFVRMVNSLESLPYLQVVEIRNLMIILHEKLRKLEQNPPSFQGNMQEYLSLFRQWILALVRKLSHGELG